jgi:ABC-type phosphate/phosphonate transport system substrate-binding protein
MAKRNVLGLLAGLLVLLACQPQVVQVQVDVTRLVETTSVNTQSTDSPPMVTVTPIISEVTRVVNQEVTRVVTSTVVEEVALEVTRAPLGSIERPVQLLFSPTVNPAIVATRGQAVADALATGTGLNFEVGILDDEMSLIQLMCAAPEDTIGFLSALAYATAHELCGVQVGNVAIREDGLSWKAGMIVARRDSGISSLPDLAGKRWAVPDVSSLQLFRYFQFLLDEAGIEVGEIIELPGDNSTLLAVYNQEADFATATYIPPILPFDDRQWEYGVDDPEIWRRVGIPPRRSPIGYVLVNGEPEFGGYRLRDARSGIFDIVPSIFDETFVLLMSPPIPNTTIAFGSDFPLRTARSVMTILVDFVASDACGSSLCSADFYAWAGLKQADEASYEALRPLVGTVGLP